MADRPIIAAVARKHFPKGAQMGFADWLKAEFVTGDHVDVLQEYGVVQESHGMFGNTADIKIFLRREDGSLQLMIEQEVCNNEGICTNTRCVTFAVNEDLVMAFRIMADDMQQALGKGSPLIPGGSEGSSDSPHAPGQNG